MNMIKQCTQILAALGLILTLTSCGGGGGNAATPVVPTPGPPGGGATDVLIELDKTQVKNTGGDFANLTITTLDANRNAVGAASVQVSVDQDALFTPSASGNVSDTNGKFIGKIGIGSNKNDRVITITVFSGTVTRTAGLKVSGSVITANFVPSNPQPGTLVTGTAKLTDANGVGIPNSLLALTGVTGIPANVTTDSQGSASYQFTAPVAGSYNLSVSGSGITQTPFPLVVSNGPGTVPNAPVLASAASASLAINPTVIAPNTVGSSVNSAQLKALFQSGANVGIQNMRVRFDIIGNLLGGGEVISTGTSTVLSDNAGVALSSYVPGIRSSPTNGVRIRICYSEADFSTTQCPFAIEQTLTVASSPLSVSIGDDNKLSRGAGDITYIKKFALLVVDSAGVAVSNAPVSISVDIDNYITGAYDYTVTPRVYLPVATCPNEDTNRNAFNDPGEDKNMNGILDPRKSDISVSYADAGIKTTNANGVLLIQVEYPQNVATWLNYTLKVSVNAAGSEGTAQRSLGTNFILGDDFNGSFLKSPYGRGDCVTYIPN
jgi:hypothetical protein